MQLLANGQWTGADTLLICAENVGALKTIYHWPKRKINEINDSFMGECILKIGVILSLNHKFKEGITLTA